MTGYGRAVRETDELSVRVEIKTLNSKFLDTGIKLGSSLADKEIELKNMVSQVLERGKTAILLTYVSKRPDLASLRINQAIVENYYKELKQTADALGAGSDDIFRMVMQMPDAYLREENEEAQEADWKVIKGVVKEALERCDQYRLQEGNVLLAQFKEYVASLHTLLDQVIALDPERVERVREKLNKQVSDFVNSDNFDPNRFEQELIYYVEKLDITEEKVRLRNHLNYFLETLTNSETRSKGKKLNFISQEIGREINTIGSKANHVGIQKVVVNMKDELEKIKEQLHNVL